MDLKKQFFVVFSAFLIETCVAYSTGAPLSACHSLIPGHGGTLPQTSLPPFTITASASSVKQNDVVNVDIVSATTPFRGFLLQARSVESPERIVGHFEPPADNLFQLMSCTGTDDTATHTSRGPKNHISLQWLAPSDFVGAVVFK